jgi:hypothetical protein
MHKVIPYYIRSDALVIFQMSYGTWVDNHHAPGCAAFCDNEILKEEDGILTVLKSFYPNDGKHFMYVHRKDISVDTYINKTV